MGLVERYHMKVYDAIHRQNQQLFTDQAVTDWAVKQGIDKTKFEQIYQSFGIDTKVQRAAAMGRTYGVQFTPSVAVNGKYWTGPSMVMSPNGGLDIPRFFEVVDRLVAMERGKPAAAGSTKKKS
jgi:thiol:disulfide interchange protein DsbA